MSVTHLFEGTRIGFVVWAELEFLCMDIPAIMQHFRGDHIQTDDQTSKFIARFEQYNQNKRPRVE